MLGCMTRGERTGSRRPSEGHPPREWLDEVERARRERRWSKRFLAAQAGVTPPTITRMFQSQASAGTVERVARSLGLEPPRYVAPSQRDEAQRLASMIEQLDPRERSAVAAFVSSLLETAKRPARG